MKQSVGNTLTTLLLASIVLHKQAYNNLNKRRRSNVSLYWADIKIYERSSEINYLLLVNYNATQVDCMCLQVIIISSL